MTKFLAIAGVVGLLGAGTGWMAMGSADTTRPDCPGKIVCPLTGEQVCADRCPARSAKEATSANAADPLCGGACPAPKPAPRTDKPKNDGAQQSNVGASPNNPAATKGKCCR